MNSLLAYVIMSGDPEALTDKLESYLSFLNTPQEDDINENIRLACMSKLQKTLCEVSPNGRLDGVCKLSTNRQQILFNFSK